AGKVQCRVWHHIAVAVDATPQAVQAGRTALEQCVADGAPTTPTLRGTSPALTVTLVLDGESVATGTVPAHAPLTPLTDDTLAQAEAARLPPPTADAETATLPPTQPACEVDGGALLLLPNAVGVRATEVRVWNGARSPDDVASGKDFALDCAEQRAKLTVNIATPAAPQAALGGPSASLSTANTAPALKPPSGSSDAPPKRSGGLRGPGGGGLRGPGSRRGRRGRGGAAAD
ncbi:unnamed protein product, partial [Symbiodinium sp. KB8]